MSETSFSLVLADGARWRLTALDPEAARVVEALAAAMRLERLDAHPDHDEDGARELRASVGPGHAPSPDPAGRGPVVCGLPALGNDDLLAIAMARLALVVARAAQARGGLLLHGALAAVPNPGAPPVPEGAADDALRGVLLAGPGTVGKSTASRRLPEPWRSLSDDATLVVRDERGRYLAHPWPTWSRFHLDSGVAGPGGRWDVQRAVPLHAVFFLSQAAEDRVEPLARCPAAALLLESAQPVTRPMTRLLDEREVRALHLEQLAAAERMALALPAFSLRLSLTGSFWREIEGVLGEAPASASSPRFVPRGRRVASSPGSRLPSRRDPHLVVYTGPSMNPTLAEPDLLEVVPFDGRPVRRGDVVCFEQPGSGREVVHRVVEVGGDGIRTRGDNGPSVDPWILSAGEILGRVVAAQRGQGRRAVAGGTRGVLRGLACRAGRLLRRALAERVPGAFRSPARAWLRRFVPTPLRPRVYAFGASHGTLLKLISAGREVGRFDPRTRRWRIRLPFRPLVDVAKLPWPAPSPVRRSGPGLPARAEPGNGERRAPEPIESTGNRAARTSTRPADVPEGPEEASP